MGERVIFHELFSTFLLKKEGYYELSRVSPNFSSIFVLSENFEIFNRRTYVIANVG